MSKRDSKDAHGLSRLWRVIALNSVGLLTIAALYGSFRLGWKWDSELLSVLSVAIGSISVLIGGAFSLFQLRFFIEASNSRPIGSGLILAAMTLPLSIALSAPDATANPSEWYMEHHGQFSDFQLILVGTISYAMTWFLVGLLLHTLAKPAARHYRWVVVAAMVTLLVAQLILIIFEASHAAYAPRS